LDSLEQSVKGDKFEYGGTLYEVRYRIDDCVYVVSQNGYLECLKQTTKVTKRKLKNDKNTGYYSDVER
jgi:hypothetical protein